MEWSEVGRVTRRTVGMLGEKDVLARVIPRLGPTEALLGPGDDAAVVSAPDKRFVVSIDTLVQDEDFRLSWPSGYESSGFDVGWKCAAQNLSDVNAMGAVPTSLVVSLTLPRTTPIAWVEDLAEGLAAAVNTMAGSYGHCSVVGGDLGRGKQVVVTAAVTGDLSGARPVLRSGAKPGHVVAHCGALGYAAGGLAALESDHPFSDWGDLQEDVAHLVVAQCRPTPIMIGPLAARAGASAMLDVSDGLVRDAGRVASASSVGIDLDASELTARAAHLAGPAARLGVDPMRWVLGGGEDYGLLATFPPDAKLPQGFTPVGRVTNGSGVTVGGVQPSVEGWDHFGG